MELPQNDLINLLMRLEQRNESLQEKKQVSQEVKDHTTALIKTLHDTEQQINQQTELSNVQEAPNLEEDYLNKLVGVLKDSFSFYVEKEQEDEQVSEIKLSAAIAEALNAITTYHSQMQQSTPKPPRWSKVTGPNTDQSA
jgi:hypothetical protein